MDCKHKFCAGHFLNCDDRPPFTTHVVKATKVYRLYHNYLFAYSVSAARISVPARTALTATQQMIDQKHCERESLLPVRQKRRSDREDDRDQICFYEANKLCEILKGPTAPWRCKGRPIVAVQKVSHRIAVYHMELFERSSKSSMW